MALLQYLNLIHHMSQILDSIIGDIVHVSISGNITQKVEYLFRLLIGLYTSPLLSQSLARVQITGQIK